MSKALSHPQQLVSVADYLEGERISEVRHEYIGGHVYAMAGASDDHNRIAGKTGINGASPRALASLAS